MYVSIYFFEPLICGLDELEDALNGAFQGKGEVTGTGTGQSGSNIDIEIADKDLDVGTILSLVKRALAPFHVPVSNKVEIDGKIYRL